VLYLYTGLTFIEKPLPLALGLTFFYPKMVWVPLEGLLLALLFLKFQKKDLRYSTYALQGSQAFALILLGLALSLRAFSALSPFSLSFFSEISFSLIFLCFFFTSVFVWKRTESALRNMLLALFAGSLGILDATHAFTEVYGIFFATLALLFLGLQRLSPCFRDLAWGLLGILACFFIQSSSDPWEYQAGWRLGIALEIVFALLLEAGYQRRFVFIPSAYGLGLLALVGYGGIGLLHASLFQSIAGGLALGLGISYLCSEKWRSPFEIQGAYYDPISFRQGIRTLHEWALAGIFLYEALGLVLRNLSVTPSFFPSDFAWIALLQGGLLASLYWGTERGKDFGVLYIFILLTIYTVFYRLFL
jgi:hypothetical protein